MIQSWTQVTSLAEVHRNGPLVVRRGGKQIALFETPRGIFACNNRCPHEGYPLKAGTLDRDCLLTCNWHNWKFDLETGDNLYGGDRLRVYPVQVRGEEVWVDLSDPPVETRRAEILANLRDAFDDNDYTRIARELGRLQLLGVDPLTAVVDAVSWSHDRMEFGWTHAFAGTAGWLELYHEFEHKPERRLACLLESVAHMADDVLREPIHPFPDGRAPFDEDAFAAAVEREDEASAVATIRGALADGLGFEGLERGFTRVALAHYNNFGHSLIYVPKAKRLIERLGPGVAEPLLLSLARGVVYARREDLIPEFRSYHQALEQWGRPGNGVAPDMHAFRKRGIEKSLTLTRDSSDADPRELYNALLGANAANMLAYDIRQQDRFDIPVSENVGWLDFTHGITFANAVRAQCSRYTELWPQGLLQLACFHGRNASHTLAQPDLEGWRVDDVEKFFTQAIDDVFDHGCDEFIVSVHRLKTLLAAREEIRAGPPPEVAETIAAALNRYLHSPLKLKQVRRTVHQARRFVALDG